METQNIEKDENSIDIRDVGNYLLGKLWLILLVTVCFAVVALLFTSLFITPTYTSTSEMFIINASPSSSSSPNTSDWSIGKQLARTAPKLITLDFCQTVADELNANTEFTEKYGTITSRQINNFVSVSSDDETCIITIKATTTNKELSADVVNAIARNFENYVKTAIRSESVRTSITLEGKVPNSPSNIHPLRNTAIFGVIGAVVICAILIIIFIFDDKIKTPDDIEKQLKLSVLGTIPDIEKEN